VLIGPERQKGNGMPIIPAPQQVTPAAGRFLFGAGARVAYGDAALAPLAGRFCEDLRRRCGARARAVPAGTVAAAHEVTVGLSDDPGLAGLPAPLGLDPAGTGGDERYALTIGEDGVTLRAREPAGVARGLASLLQLIATAAPAAGGAVPLPAARILDAPRFAWRGLTVDVVRTFFGPMQIRKVIDLIALYKLNVLHLHLTDDQGWRIEAGRPDHAREPDGTFYTNDELRALVAYAADRFVTVVPEVDTPGHAAALLRLHPELDSGRNLISYELGPGQAHQSIWLDPGLPATFDVLDTVFAELAGVFPGPFINIGGDEPFGMPDDAYAAYVGRLKPAVRALGKRTMGWQESIRAGADPGHVIQHWISAASPGSGGEVPLPPETAAAVSANAARARADIEQALEHGVPVIVSPQSNCYLDVPYAEASADAAQAERRNRVGLRFYAPKTLSATFDWEPAAALGTGARPGSIAGVGAAVWCETVRDFDDLTFLLLPRLAGTAEKAWGAAGAVRWEEHRAALARHGRLWEQDGLTFFRAETVDWPQGGAPGQPR
jgi:hexosaminidase